MEMREYLLTVRKRWATVALITLLATAGALGVTLLATPQYEATTRLFFAVQAGESVSDLAQGSSFTEKQMSSYAQVARSPLVLEPVIDQLGLDVELTKLTSMVRATVPLNTVILEVTATSSDPDQAALIANAVGVQLSETVSGLSPERPDGSQAVLATTLTPATAPEAPSSPNAKQNLALGLLFGLALGLGVALLRESLDTKIRSERDLAAVSDRSLLGSIVFDPEASTHPVVMQDDPHGQRAESIRRLRTNLQFVDIADSPHSIVVTSSVPAEGKTTTVVNLAIALADAGSRVVLVDADLRRPSVARTMGLEGSVGLTTVLIGRAELSDVVQPWNRTSLDVLPTGQIPPNPSELLGSHAMATLLGQLTQQYDVVLIDSAPLLPVADTVILSKIAGGTLMVVGTDRIHKDELRSALEALDAVDAHVLGLVLNKVEAREMGYYGYGYTYSSDRSQKDPAIPEPPVATSARGEVESSAVAAPGTRPSEPLTRRAR